MAQTVNAVLQSGWARFAVLLVAALLIRGQTFGHPLLHMDENFYQLVGDRMVRDGAWPYVDIWDRKPPGLFALFAAFRLLGEGFLPYQLAALAAVTGTAWIIVRLAERAVAPQPALVGGVAYLAGLTFFGGYGGQAPIFFNLLMAAAALVLVRIVIDPVPRSENRILSGGLWCMLLVGLAMQLKYSVVFEGILFGLVLLYAARNAGWGKLALWGLLWIGAALLPTLIAWGIYAAAGHQQDFLYANFISIFQRESSFDGVAQKRLFSLLGLMSPFILLSLPAWKARAHTVGQFALGWLGFAFAGLFLLGTYYNHYGLPMLLPLSITLAIGLGMIRWNNKVLGGIAAIAVLSGGIGTAVKLARKGDADDIAYILSFVPPDATTCPWFLGTTGATLYITSGACLPSRYPLSGHLFERHEARAIGADQNAEIRAILALRPPVITLDQTPRPEEDMLQRARFLEVIAADYRLADVRETGKSDVMIYVRRSR